MAGPSKLNFVAQRVLLPDSDYPYQPASVEVDVASGKIVAIRERGGFLYDDDTVNVEVPHPKILLPGLIEYVLARASLTMTNVSDADTVTVHMCT